jgi:hypothetical protein
MSRRPANPPISVTARFTKRGFSKHPSTPDPTRSRSGFRDSRGRESKELCETPPGRKRSERVASREAAFPGPILAAVTPLELRHATVGYSDATIRAAVVAGLRECPLPDVPADPHFADLVVF